MATSNLDILIRIATRGADKLRGLDGELRRLDGQSQQTGTRLERLGRFAIGAGVAIGGIAYAAKQGYDALKQGAQLELARDQFERLTASINTTSDAMLGRLQEATGGLVTSAELISSANQIISLGLAKNEDGVVRLANVVARLGLDMQQVIMTFANNSKMRLDALGVSIEAVDEKTEKFIEQGYNMDQAFDLAVIEALEDRVALLGDTSQTTAGKIQRLETAFLEAKDAALLFIAETAFLADNAQDAREELLNQAGAIAATADSYDDWIVQLERAGIGVEELEQAMSNDDTLRWYMKEIQDLYTEMRTYNRGAEDAILATTGYGQSLTPIPPRLMQMASAAGSADQALFNYIGMTNDATAASERLARQLGITAGQLAGVTNYLGKSSYSGGGVATAAVQSSKLLGSLKDLKPVAESAGGGVASIVDPAEEAAEAMRRLDAATGDFFMRARDMEEWDPFENFAEILDRAGGNATTIADFLLASGKDAGKINEALGRTAVDTASQGIVDALMRGEISAEDAAAKIGEIQAKFEGNTEAARAFLETIETPPEDIEVDAEFSAAYDALAAFDAEIAKPRSISVGADIGGGGSTAGSGESGRPASRTDADAAMGANFIVPPGYHNDSYLVGVTSGEHVQVTPAGRRGSGDTYNIYNYNRQAAAITRAMFQLRRATGIDRRMGVMA